MTREVLLSLGLAPALTLCAYLFYVWLTRTVLVPALVEQARFRQAAERWFFVLVLVAMFIGVFLGLRSR